MFNDLRIEPLVVWHEDVLADRATAARQIADYVGVAIEPQAAVWVPQIEKQSPGDARDWIEQHERSQPR